jgi:hypothetical protein
VIQRRQKEVPESTPTLDGARDKFVLQHPVSQKRLKEVVGIHRMHMPAVDQMGPHGGQVSP